MTSPSGAPGCISFGEFQANLKTRELARRGFRVRLPDQSFLLLAMLLERPGELVTREEISKTLWPADTFVDFDHGLNNAVNRLREALEDSADGPRYIETLPRRGYRFVAEINGHETANFPTMSPLETTELKSEGQERIAVQAANSTRAGSKKMWRRLLWAVAVLGLLVVLGGIRLHTKPILPLSRSYVLPPEGNKFNLSGDSGGSVVITPDGTQLAFVAVNAKGVSHVWVRPLGKLAAEEVDGTEGATFPFWSPDGSSIGFFADGRLKKVNVGGGKAVTLCEAPFGRGGSWNREGVILFAPGHHTGIYRVADSGGTPVAVTKVDVSLHTTHRWPKFLPDGKHFIYLAANHFPDTTHNGVYFNSLDGRENKFVVLTDTDSDYASGYLFYMRGTALVAQSFDVMKAKLQGEPRRTVERVLCDSSIWKAVFDVSENGVMAYQLGEKVTGAQFRWFDRSGNELGMVGEPRFQGEQRLSRDGKKLAFGQFRKGNIGYSDIWVHDFDRLVKTQVTFGEHDSGSPVWTLDGSRIFFASKRQHYSVYQVDSTGLGQEELILDTGADAWPLDVSPDGRFLLFGQGDAIGRLHSQLWVYPLESRGSPFRLRAGNFRDGEGQFSPDGRWVTFSSSESGQDEIYVSSFGPRFAAEKSGSKVAAEKWRISPAGGHRPKWRRDGKELFYIAPDGSLTAVSIRTRGANLQIGAPRPLFRTNVDPSFGFDASADGKRFVILTAPPENNAPLTLVENWPSDFKK